MRQSYEKAEQDEQYAALATSLPQAAAALAPVARAERDAARQRDPVSALGAGLLGVQDRAAQAGTLFDEARYGEAGQLARQATSRSDVALLVGLGLLLGALLVLVAVGWLVWRTVAGPGRHRDDVARGWPTDPRSGDRPAPPAVRTG